MSAAEALRLLIVEDSERDARLMVRALQRHGFAASYRRVTGERELAEALGEEPWQAALVDHNLPGFSGPAAIQLIRQRDPDLPLIVVSGTIGEEIAVDCMKAGAHDYLMKGNLLRLGPALERELREAVLRRERRQAEQERSRLQAMVQQAQKLEAIGELAAGVAHDFNNVLTAILGYCDILLKRMEPGANLNFVSQIQAACQRASSLTQGLLAFGRKQLFSPQPLELNSWLANLRGFLSRLLREDVQLELQPAAEPLPLNADEAQLEQVLLNLLTNARDAMPAGGSITVTTSRQGPWARISVSDTGTGMDEGIRARIFEPLFTTKPRGKGTGLGLAVVWGIVQQHRGSIEVDSEPGRGTTFRIRLPLSAASPQPAEASQEQAQPGGAETVLLAADDDGLREMLAAALKEAGYTVRAAADGKQALRLYAAEQARIDAAILDLVIPKATGERVMEEIRASSPDLPVLLISGHTAEAASRRPDSLSGARLLRKPFTMAELLRSLREALDA